MQLGQFGFYGVDRIQRILAIAHHNDAAGDLPFAVIFRHTAANFRAEPYRRHIGKQHRHAVTAGDRYIAEVIQIRQIAGGTHHVFRFAQFQQRTAALLVRLTHRLHDLLMRDIECPKPFRL